ncbi:hypothetical protein [Thermoleophilum album]|uniref:Serine/threonine-protein kinase RsbW n=1 Tax=Thermoleophilum album TaxID=29539 RepID=A0A1H6FK58_THEAL|nr:hypothetical protein [Thermoleophilum album]SEH11241.1 hypothetical protein SAMN02745716_0703 [Thermoleophilum album]
MAEIGEQAARSSAPRRRDVKLTIPPRSDYLLLTRLALAAICRAADLDLAEVADLKLAVTEAAGAFMDPDDHPSQTDDGEPTLAISYALSGEELRIEITARDDRQPRPLPELAQALIAATVDEFEVSDRGLTLVKHLRRR